MGKFAGLADRIGVTVKAGSEVFCQGDAGDTMYFIYSGSVEVTRGKDAQRTVLGRLGPGEFFGEMALLDEGSRTATVAAVSDVRLIPITRRFVRENIHRDMPFLFQLLEAISLRLESTGEILWERVARTGQSADYYGGRAASSPPSMLFLKIFRGFADPERYRHLKSDEVIFNQGDFGDLMYIVLEGAVTISVQFGGETCVLGELGRGDFFGETSLISGGARSSTATALTPATLLPVDRDTFIKGISGDPEAALYLLQVLIRRLRSNLEAIGE